MGCCTTLRSSLVHLYARSVLASGKTIVAGEYATLGGHFGCGGAADDRLRFTQLSRYAVLRLFCLFLSWLRRSSAGLQDCCFFGTTLATFFGRTGHLGHCELPARVFARLCPSPGRNADGSCSYSSGPFVPRSCRYLRLVRHGRVVCEEPEVRMAQVDRRAFTGRLCSLHNSHVDHSRDLAVERADFRCRHIECCCVRRIARQSPDPLFPRKVDGIRHLLVRKARLGKDPYRKVGRVQLIGAGVRQQRLECSSIYRKLITEGTRISLGARNSRTSCYSRSEFLVER